MVAVEERGAPKKKEKWPKENVNRQFRETWKKPKGVIQTVPGPWTQLEKSGGEKKRANAKAQATQALKGENHQGEKKMPRQLTKTIKPLVNLE